VNDVLPTTAHQECQPRLPGNRESLGRVGTELEALTARGSEVLPGVATAAYM
jgi:hypothetical protein